MVRLGKSNPPTIYTWRQPPGRLLALFLSWDVTLVRLDLFTLNHQYFPHHYFIFPPVLQIQCSSCCGVALVITIIHHRSCVIDHTSETIGNRSETILLCSAISTSLTIFNTLAIFNILPCSAISDISTSLSQNVLNILTIFSINCGQRWRALHRKKGR